MKSHNLMEVHFQSFTDFKTDVRKALAKKTRSIQPKNQIYFDSVSSFRNFMTIQKIELLTVIANQKLSSIYELAKLVDRDFAAVLRDCTALASMGFILLKETNDAKKTKIPRLPYSYAGLAIYLPKNPYQIEFHITS